MNHEPSVTIRQIFASVSEKHKDRPDNSGVIIDGTVDEVMLAIEEGLLDEKPPGMEEMLRTWCRSQVQTRRISTTNSVRKQISDGALGEALDLGEAFEDTFTVCGPEALTASYGIKVEFGRIITLGSLTGDDVRLMALEQRIAFEKLKAAVKRDQPRYASFGSRLAKYRDYRSYKDSLADQ